MNGGYVMFDASVLDLDNGGTLTGLYAKMQELFNSGKPLLLCNVNHSFYSIKSSFVFFTYNNADDEYYIELLIDNSMYILTIANDDSYTFSD